ncbi:DUF2905 domain-containing protein [bacterium]|nr:DUF2905 domain-containing protein [bacterium]
MGRIVLIVGLVLVLAGAILLAAGKLGLGHLPGDILIRRGSLRIYIPIASSILLSLLLSAILWIVRK